MTAFTTAHHPSLFWVWSIQFISHSSNSWSILILPSHLRLGLPSGSFFQVSPPKLCIHLTTPHTCYMPTPSHSSNLITQNKIWWRIQIIKLTCSFLHSCYLIPLRPKCHPQNPQPTSMWVTKFCTHKKQHAKLQFCIILIFIFLESKLEDKRFCAEW